MRAASIGSGPVVVWPSVSRMIAADVYEPGGTGLGGRLVGAPSPGRAALDLRWPSPRGFDERRSNSASGKIVFSDTRMPLPTAVPRWSWKRSIAAMMSSRLCVGGCTTAAVAANDTTPMRVVLRLLVDERARRRPARPRAVRLDVGRAHAARDVHRQDDRLVLRRQRDDRRGPRDRDDHQREARAGTGAAGRGGAAAGPRPSRPSPSRGSRSAARASSSAAAAARTRPRPPAPATSSHSISGHRKRHRVRSQVLRHAAAGGELAAPLAQVGEAHDRVDEVVVGRELERVDAGVAERRAQLLLALLRRRREALAEAAVVRVDEELLAGLGVLDRRAVPRSGSSISSGS